jgi:hypothetical protein
VVKILDWMRNHEFTAWVLIFALLMVLWVWP